VPWELNRLKEDCNGRTWPVSANASERSWQPRGGPTNVIKGPHNVGAGQVQEVLCLNRNCAVLKTDSGANRVLRLMAGFSSNIEEFAPAQAFL
jgi:hypothetical protein